MALLCRAGPAVAPLTQLRVTQATTQASATFKCVSPSHVIINRCLTRRCSLAPAVAPIFKAAMDVFEGHITAMHQQSWGPAAAAAGSGGGAAGDDSAAAAAAAAAEAPVGFTETSSYVTELANAIAVFRCAAAFSFESE